MGKCLYLHLHRQDEEQPGPEKKENQKRLDEGTEDK